MIIILLITAVIACGCEKTLTKEQIIEVCIQACHDAKQNLINGPCLLDPIPNTEWVCDIAHNPREAIDNARENQCNAWHSGAAKHFVEVTPECEFVKAV